MTMNYVVIRIPNRPGWLVYELQPDGWYSQTPHMFTALPPALALAAELNAAV
jgi:hypothetical protein